MVVFGDKFKNLNKIDSKMNRVIGGSVREVLEYMFLGFNAN